MFPLYYLYLFLFSCNYLLLELDGVVVYLNLLCFSFIVFNFTYFSLCMSENVYIWIWVLFFKRYSFFHINIFDICMCVCIVCCIFRCSFYFAQYFSILFVFFFAEPYDTKCLWRIVVLFIIICMYILFIIFYI